MSPPHDHRDARRALARVGAKLLPPALTTDIADAQSKLGRPLPQELRKLLNFTTGLHLDWPLGLTGQFGGVGLDELHPRALHLMDDGFGNSFIYDVGGDDNDAARVLFSCHDPPATLFVTASLAEFLIWAVNLELGEPNALDDLESWLRRCSDSGRGTIVANGAARTLGAGESGISQLVRTSAPGDGFWWSARRGRLAARRLSEGPEFELWREAQ